MTIAATLPLPASLPVAVALPGMSVISTGNTLAPVAMIGGQVSPVLPSDHPAAGGAFPALFAAAGDEIAALPLPATPTATFPAKAAKLAAPLPATSHREAVTDVPVRREPRRSLPAPQPASEIPAARPSLPDAVAPVPDKVTEADPAVRRVPGETAAAVVANEQALPTTAALAAEAAAVIEPPAVRDPAWEATDSAVREGVFANVRARAAAAPEAGPVAARRGRAPFAPEVEMPPIDAAIAAPHAANAALPPVMPPPVSVPVIFDAAASSAAAAPAVPPAPKAMVSEAVVLPSQRSAPMAGQLLAHNVAAAPPPAPPSLAALPDALSFAPASAGVAQLQRDAPQRLRDAPIAPDVPATVPANAALPVSTAESGPARTASAALPALPAHPRPPNGQPVVDAVDDRRSRVAHSDVLDGALAALGAMPNAPPRAVVAGHDAVPLRAVPPMPEAALDLAVATDRLGDVRILVEGSANDLKVALGLAPATLLAAGDVQRLAQGLAADLAAAGVRLQSLQVSGGGAGGEAFAANDTGGGSAQGQSGQDQSAQDQSAQGQSAQGNREPPPGYPLPPAAMPAGTPRAPRSDRYA